MRSSGSGSGSSPKRSGYRTAPSSSREAETTTSSSQAGSGGTTFGGHGALHTALLVSTGVATAVPLILFAAAASRVPLSTIGLLQFLTPFLQLLTGVLLLGEVVPATRWVGFAMVWVALVVLSVDMVRQVRRSRRTRRRCRSGGIVVRLPSIR